MVAGVDFGAAYPKVHRALRHSLRGLRMTDEQAEDAIHDAYLKAMASGIQFARVSNLVNFCYVVAKHSATDEWRAQQRHRDDRDIPDLAVPDPAPSVAEARLAWEETVRALHVLTELERRVVVNVIARVIGLSPDEQPPAVDRLRLHYARARLRRYVKGFPAVLAWRPWRRLRGLVPQPSALLGTATTLAVVFLALDPRAPLRVADPERAGRPMPPPTLAETRLPPARAELTPSAAPVPAQALALVRSGGRPPSRPRVDLPQAEGHRVAVTQPNGGNLVVQTLPNSGAEPLACFATPAVGTLCVPNISPG